MTDRTGQVWRSLYHRETFLVLRPALGPDSVGWLEHRVLTLDSERSRWPGEVHGWSELDRFPWEESDEMERVA